MRETHYVSLAQLGEDGSLSHEPRRGVLELTCLPVLFVSLVFISLLLSRLLNYILFSLDSFRVIVCITNAFSVVISCVVKVQEGDCIAAVIEIVVNRRRLLPFIFQCLNEVLVSLPVVPPLFFFAAGSVGRIRWPACRTRAGQQAATGRTSGDCVASGRQRRRTCERAERT